MNYLNNFSKTPFQIFAENTLFAVFQNPHVSLINTQNGVKDVVKYVIHHYPEFAHDGKKSYQNIKRYKKYHRFSERAWKALEKAEAEKLSPDKIVKEILYYEHLCPTSCLKEKLVASFTRNGNQLDKEEIESIMTRSEVIIITREEANVLDSSKSKDCLLEGKMVKGVNMKTEGDCERRLKAVGITFAKKFATNSIQSDH